MCGLFSPSPVRYMWNVWCSGYDHVANSLFHLLLLCLTGAASAYTIKVVRLGSVQGGGLIGSWLGWSENL